MLWSNVQMIYAVKCRLCWVLMQRTDLLTTLNKFHMCITMVQKLNVVICWSVSMLLLLLTHVHTHTQIHIRISSWASTLQTHHNLLLLSCLKSTDYKITVPSQIWCPQRPRSLPAGSYAVEIRDCKQQIELTHIKNRRREEKDWENRDGWTPWSRTFHPWGHWPQTHILKLRCVSAGTCSF